MHLQLIKVLICLDMKKKHLIIIRVVIIYNPFNPPSLRRHSHSMLMHIRVAKNMDFSTVLWATGICASVPYDQTDTDKSVLFFFP